MFLPEKMNGSSRLTIEFILQTPAVIRPQAALSDRETMETEVISTSICLHDFVCFMLISLQNSSFIRTSTSSSER